MKLNLPDNIIKGTFSKKRDHELIYQKGKIQKIKTSNKIQYQVSLYTEKQVFHKNYDEREINSIIEELFDKYFTNLEVFTSDYIYGYRVTSKGKLLTNKRKSQEALIEVEHNKTKNYILSEGMVIPPLVDLGVMTSDGKIVKAKYDKFKQINRFLEIIEDSIQNEEKLNIIDFGCGKSYLTFVLYFYLVKIKKINCEIIGLDLKEDVIDVCNQIAVKYGYKDHLKFFKGDISKFKNLESIDMILTLHACDTATDYALYHAIQMKCKYIFSVPCCQHELNAQLDSTYFHIINKFGILKERFSAILTDAIRANILQYFGYKTQVMEFVDFENSPKNLLIRAVRTNTNINLGIKKEIDELVDTLGTNQTLYNLFFK